MFAIAMITVLRLREAPFLILLGFGLLISYCISGLGAFTADVAGQELIFGEQAESSVLLGTILLVLLGSLIAVFNAAAEIPRDVSSRMIAILLSKPVSRHRYVWGKFLGTLILGLTCTGLWLSFMLACRLFRPPEGGEVLSMVAAGQQYFCLLLLVPVTAISTGISCYFSDIISMIVTSFYLLMTFVAALLPVIISLMSELLAGKALLIPYYLFPNLVYFLHSYVSPLDYAILFAYAGGIAVLFVLLGRLGFERGDVF